MHVHTTTLICAVFEDGHVPSILQTYGVSSGPTNTENRHFACPTKQQGALKSSRMSMGSPISCERLKEDGGDEMQSTSTNLKSGTETGNRANSRETKTGTGVQDEGIGTLWRASLDQYEYPAEAAQLDKL
ncbi:hypothetical protein B0H11DRAFT_1916227 [Mycena galericulata]|nr:hypothetical protein B0H11DRAFT_1916227 [Mycena galericulata]